jgi:hypothetical protein
LQKGAHGCRRGKRAPFRQDIYGNLRGKAELGGGLGGPQRLVIALIGAIVTVNGAVAADELGPPAVGGGVDRDIARRALGVDRLPGVEHDDIDFAVPDDGGHKRKSGARPGWTASSNHDEKATLPQIFATLITDITKINWRNVLRCSMMHLSPLFSSKKIDSARCLQRAFFCPKGVNKLMAHSLLNQGVRFNFAAPHAEN